MIGQTIEKKLEDAQLRIEAQRDPFNALSSSYWASEKIVNEAREALRIAEVKASGLRKIYKAANRASIDLYRKRNRLHNEIERRKNRKAARR